MIKHFIQRSHHAGFSIVSTIFIVVVLAAVSTAVVNTSTISISASSLSLQRLQASYAAQSANAWMIYSVRQAGMPYGCPSSSKNISFTQGGLSGYTGTVTCTANTFGASGSAVSISAVGSATNGNGTLKSSNTTTLIPLRGPSACPAGYYSTGGAQCIQNSTCQCSCAGASVIHWWGDSRSTWNGGTDATGNCSGGNPTCTGSIMSQQTNVRSQYNASGWCPGS